MILCVGFVRIDLCEYIYIFVDVDGSVSDQESKLQGTMLFCCRSPPGRIVSISIHLIVGILNSTH